MECLVFEMKEFSIKFGKNLADARISLGLSQSFVAYESGLLQSDISRFEQGNYISVKALKYLVYLRSKDIDLNKIFEIY